MQTEIEFAAERVRRLADRIIRNRECAKARPSDEYMNDCRETWNNRDARDAERIARETYAGKSR
jgi:hypothetical protein